MTSETLATEEAAASIPADDLATAIRVGKTLGAARDRGNADVEGHSDVDLFEEGEEVSGRFGPTNSGCFCCA
ncbi:hypothetical protein ACWDRB_46475 [Nonomuraea sp. NPDC003707]|uniref:hypothetical protein n=1 Tax=Nonomuraea angiospora TaxID=46172 RepID=UPI00344EA76B